MRTFAIFAKWGLVGAAVALACFAVIFSGAAPAPQTATTAAPFNSDPCAFPLPLPTQVGEAIFEQRLYAFLDNGCYAKQSPPWTSDRELRDTGPFLDMGNLNPTPAALGTHPAVKIWYSPEVMRWLDGGRKGAIADGGMIVKEMHDPPASAANGIDGWTTMFRDHNGSYDGWYWSYHAPPSSASNAPASQDARKAALAYPNSGFGLYCLNCHASVDNAESTFASRRNIDGDPLTYLVVSPTLPNPHPELLDLHDLKAGGGLGAEAKRIPTPNSHLLRTFEPVVPQLAKRLETEDPVPFPVETFDHVVAAALPAGPQQFITSDQCIGCHDATQNMAAPPNMIYPAAGGNGPITNLSPYGEWRASMMGLAGRDPVFYAQLESELTRYPMRKTFIQDTCFRCHGVMGERQLQIDRGPNAHFTEEMVYTEPGEPDAEYGALAREGISCATCHHIAAEGLGKPETFTGLFQVGPRTEIYGPFENPTKRPMEQALGLTPKHAPQIQSAALCGTCHTIELPVLNKKGEQIGTHFEQATYLEWLNSSFQNERAPVPSTARTCQSCHMPQVYQAEGSQPQKLSYRIASIEDNTFPLVDNRAPDAEITLPVRDPYSRHTLLGLNVFVLEMFRQFSDLLGIRSADPMATYGTPIAGLDTSIRSATQLAAETAKVEILSLAANPGSIDAEVKVTNLAGHSFPSGVEFRRTFLDVELLDQKGQVLWASGATNSIGVITDGAGGAPLPSEFFLNNPKTGQQAYQPHHEVITRQDQVQIYEELVKDPEGKFTTSFLSLAQTVKNNKLQPSGWSRQGPYAEITEPVGGAALDPSYRDGSGSDTVTYRIPRNATTSAGTTLSVRLWYQTIPPSYLMQRFLGASGKNTQRLIYLATHVDYTGTPVEGWRLAIGEARRAVR